MVIDDERTLSGMFDCESLPEDNEQLGTVPVELPSIPGESESSCPVEIESVVAYLRMEARGGDQLTVDDLTFERTVDLGDAQFWVWSFRELEGADRAYATVRRNPDGALRSGYEADYYGLSPAQFVIAEYCGCW